ncbi:HAD family hydrolase [Pseudohaliea sp.]|uniref:HAD family hydrolase n=1 Tax=Pseudohaliea sp. TaxID=2740289 RepID=UPI0032EB6625
MKACFLGSSGVVVESARLQRLAYNAAFKDMGLELYWNVATYCKLLEVPGGQRWLEHVLGDEWPEGLAEEVQALQHRHFLKLVEGGLWLRPGIANAISLCRREGIALAWVTTATPDMVGALLTHTVGLDVEAFDLITTAEDVSTLKPDPGVYYHALSTLGLEAADVIAVEDRPVNQSAALQADLQCYLYPGEYAAVEHNLLVTRDVPGTLERAIELFREDAPALPRGPVDLGDRRGQEQ